MAQDFVRSVLQQCHYFAPISTRFATTMTKHCSESVEGCEIELGVPVRYKRIVPYNNVYMNVVMGVCVWWDREIEGRRRLTRVLLFIFLCLIYTYTCRSFKREIGSPSSPLLVFRQRGTRTRLVLYNIVAIRFPCGCMDFPEVTLCTPSRGPRTIHTV